MAPRPPGVTGSPKKTSGDLTRPPNHEVIGIVVRNGPT